MNISRKRVRSAFTLMELLVAVVIIAVLAAVIIPKFTDQTKRSRESALKADLTLLRSAVQNYQTDTGAYPTKLDDLVATKAPAKGPDTTGKSITIIATDWHGPYVQGTIPVDPISRKAFTYSVKSGTVGNVTSSAGTPYTTW